MHRVTSVIVICVLGLVLVLGSGCSGSRQPATSGGQTPSTTGGATSSGGTATDGAALAQDRCTQCHTFDRVQAAQKDKAGWESTVDRMVGHGLEVTDAERTAIIDYLVSK